MASHLKLEKNRDVATARALNDLKSRRKLSEKIGSLKVEKTADFRGMRLLFTKYTENGVERKQVSAMEKDAETGLWFPTYVSAYMLRDDPKLKDAYEDWEDP